MTIFRANRERSKRVGLRCWNIAVGAAAAALVSLATPAGAASVNAQAKAKVVKPLALKAVQDLDLGIVLLGPGTWSGATVTLSRDGALTCSANVTCSGATQVAVYNVSGSKSQTVVVTAPDVTLVSQGDSSQMLTLVVDAPATVTLTNSGARGTDFPLGGSISVDSTTADGEYAGTFEVTAEYQ